MTWNPIKLWRLWRLTEEVKDMKGKALIKLAVAAAAAAVATGSAQYLATDAVSLSAVGSAVLAAVLAYLKRSPMDE